MKDDGPHSSTTYHSVRGLGHVTVFVRRSTLNTDKYTLLLVLADELGGGEPIASCGVTITPPGAWIYNVEVDTEVRYKGVGTIMLEKCIELAQAANCEGIALNVKPENEKAVKLYKKLGFFCAFVQSDTHHCYTKRLQ